MAAATASDVVHKPLAMRLRCSGCCNRCFCPHSGARYSALALPLLPIGLAYAGLVLIVAGACNCAFHAYDPDSSLGSSCMSADRKRSRLPPTCIAAAAAEASCSVSSSSGSSIRSHRGSPVLLSSRFILIPLSVDVCPASPSLLPDCQRICGCWCRFTSDPLIATPTH